jgi:NitT/TauT family transport system ATP-binding protein
LTDINLDVPDGHIVTIFGPNGSGKTTLLNIIAGVETLDSGTVSVSGANSNRPQIGYAFQNFRDSLLPWESSLDNISFSLRAKGIPRLEARTQALSFLEKHNLNIPYESYPYQLSIGQQQLVALARTLIQYPGNVLLDEPFTALDHEMRFRMQDIAVSVLQSTNTSIIFVSHDVDEAIYLSDELFLLSKRPAKIVSRFSIPFNRPRHHDLLASVEFAELRRRVVGAFLDELKP